MSRYVIEVDLDKDDCSFCPCFESGGSLHVGYCCAIDIDGGKADSNEVAGVLRDGVGPWRVWCYDRPDWCPMVDAEEYVTSELVANASSQPKKDEEKQVARIELYESEWDKVEFLSLKYRLTVAQTIAKLVEEAQ